MVQYSVRFFNPFNDGISEGFTTLKTHEQKVSRNWSKLIALGHWEKLVTVSQVTNYQKLTSLEPSMTKQNDCD